MKSRLPANSRTARAPTATRIVGSVGGTAVMPEAAKTASARNGGAPTKVLIKALAVLERLAERGGEAGISELAREVDLDKATVFRLLSTLLGAGYIAKIESSGRYRLTSRLADLAGRSASPRSLMELALPFMRELAQETKETAYVAVINGTEAVFLDKVEGEQTIRVHTPSGSRIPLQCGSAAKVLLAFQPAEIVECVTAQLTPMTRFTITDPQLLRRELANIFARGYAIGEQEWRLGVSGVAAPVRNPSGAVIAAIAISGPSARLPRTRLQALAKPVMAAALRLSQALGWRPEPSAARAHSAPRAGH